MSIVKGFNFRNTAGYVADDGANCTYWRGNAQDYYDVFRNGIHFGEDHDLGGSLQGSDKNSGLDPRFAGLCHADPPLTWIATLRVDLPHAGDWRIRAAFGYQEGTATIYALFKDDATVFATVSGSTTGARKYLDITSTERSSEADWIANNVGIVRTFTSTILRVQLGNNVDTDAIINHLLIEEIESVDVTRALIEVGNPLV